MSEYDADDGYAEDKPNDPNAQAELPTKLRHLRACLRCKLIKQSDQFADNGCDNCGNTIDYQQFTTPVFRGMVAMMQPTSSWVARYNQQTNRARGLYAIKVIGSLPSDG